MPTLSPEDQTLLRRTLRGRVAADGSLSFPLVPALKAHSWLELCGLFGLCGMMAWIPLLEGPRRLSELLSLSNYLAEFLGFQGVVFLLLVRRRKMLLPSHANEVILCQCERELRFKFGPEPEIETDNVKTDMLRMDGGNFRPKRRMFVRKRTYVKGIAIIERWLRTRWREAHGTEEDSQAVGAYLALLDVVDVGYRKVVIRVGVQPERETPLCLLASLPTLFLGMASAVGLIHRVVMTAILGAASSVWAVYFRRRQLQITIEAGAYVRVKNGRKEQSYPASQCRFLAYSPSASEDDGRPFRPHIALEFPIGRRQPCIVMKSREYDERDLTIFTRAMNRFLWGDSPAPRKTG